MRILVDARVGWGSGIGRYIENVVPRVARARADDAFVVQTPPEYAAQARTLFDGVANIAVRTVDVASFSLREQVAMNRLADGFDLTWFTNYWVPLAFRGRFMATVHDLLHLDPDLFPASVVKRRLSRLTFAKIARSAAAVSFGSRFSQREFERRFGVPDHAAVHYYGIDHADWRLFDPDAPPPKAKRLLAVGASKAHKNFELLLEAWRRADVPDGWTLSVISPDQRLRSSIDLAEASRGAARTDVRSGLTNADLHALYAETAIMLTPSLYEGFGLPFMEAMQAGALCISSTAQSMVEIGEGAYAWYVNGADLEGWVRAIEAGCRFFDTGEIDFAPLQRRNMQLASRFTWDRVVDRTCALLAEALDGCAD
ncbi:MAG TPA: glycosyltransferase family 1 protein [Sphingomonas sp.]|jgi:glycosyltransferase involved in cell wall biosynthesis